MISEYFVKTLLAMSLKVIRNLTKKYTGISERLAALISKLFESGRMKDARRAAEDEEARKRFYREFGMIDE